MAEQIIQCASACTITLQHEVAIPLFNITMDEGAQISLAIAGVWVVGWGIRQLIDLLKTGASTYEDEKS